METRRITRTGMLTALALLLSYVEMLLPSFIPVPGIKLGLANTAVVFALYTLPLADVLFISVLRVFISSLLFGNVLSLVYSLAGAVLSLAVMALLYRLKLPLGAVSVTGGVVHNSAQLLVASLVLSSTSIFYYLPFLIFSGAVTGFVIGLVAQALCDRLDEEYSFSQRGGIE